MDIKHRFTGNIIISTEGDSLRGANLSDANLIGADLSGADLIGANHTKSAIDGPFTDRQRARYAKRRAKRTVQDG